MLSENKNNTNKKDVVLRNISLSEFILSKIKAVEVKMNFHATDHPSPKMT